MEPLNQRLPRPLRILTAVGALLLLMASLSKGLGPLHRHLLERPLLLLGAGLLGAVFAYTPALGKVREGLFRLLFKSRSSRFHLTLGILSFLLFAGVGWKLFKGLPFLDDGVAALFQARLFAAFQVTDALPEIPEFFHQVFVLGHRENLLHRCGMYPPGWPTLLVPGVWLGIPHLVNPLLGALLVVSIARFGREVYNPIVGRTAGLLALGSPFLLVLNGTFLSHTPTMLFLVLCAWAVLRLLRSGHTVYGLAAGACWGTAFLCRPLTALLVGTCIGLLVLCQWRRALAAWRGVILAGLLAIAAGAVQAAFQQVTTGDFRTPGHQLGMGRRGKFGFQRIDWSRTHTPKIGVTHTVIRLRALNEQIIGWPLPALLLSLFPLISLRGRWMDIWLLLPLLFLAALYAAYWYFEYYFHARYLSAAVPFLLILTARGLDVLRVLCHHRPVWPRGLLPLGIVGALVISAFSIPPVFLDRYRGAFGDVEPRLPRILQRFDVHQALVFMDGVGADRVEDLLSNDYYATGFVRNRIDLQGDIVYARNMQERNPELCRLYPDRAYYLYRFDRAVHDGQLYELHLEGDRFRLRQLYPALEPALAPMAESPSQ